MADGIRGGSLSRRRRRPGRHVAAQGAAELKPTREPDADAVDVEDVPAGELREGLVRREVLQADGAAPLLEAVGIALDVRVPHSRQRVCARPGAPAHRQLLELRAHALQPAAGHLHEQEREGANNDRCRVYVLGVLVQVGVHTTEVEGEQAYAYERERLL